MLTVLDLKHHITRLEAEGTICDRSEVRYVSRRRGDNTPAMDCSFEDQVTCMEPGMTPDGQPKDRRFGQGVLMLAQESVMQPANEQTLLDLDW